MSGHGSCDDLQEDVFERAAARVQPLQLQLLRVGPGQQPPEIGLQRGRLEHVLVEPAVHAQRGQLLGSGAAGARKEIRAGTPAATSPSVPQTASPPSRMIATRSASASASSR